MNYLRTKINDGTERPHGRFVKIVIVKLDSPYQKEIEDTVAYISDGSHRTVDTFNRCSLNNQMFNREVAIIYSTTHSTDAKQIEPLLVTPSSYGVIVDLKIHEVFNRSRNQTLHYENTG